MSGHKNAKKITPDMIYRMALQSMDPHALKQELKHPLPFDYQNAAAGEVRALFDTCFGSTLTAQLNYSLGRLSPNKCNVSVGRNQCLAIRSIIMRKKTLGANEEKDLSSF
jgi:DNA topoisomerase IA